jgi:uncharacterized protein YcnI
MRKALIFLIALLVTLALPGVAGAHIEVEPAEAPGGKPANLNLVIPHGCDGAATTSITVQVPSSTKAKGKSAEGWKASNGSGQMKWTGGPLPDHQVQGLPFTATFYGKKGSRVPFKLIQGCEGGASTSWLQVVAEGAPEPETPAPIVTLTSAAAAPAASTTESGSSGETASEGAKMVHPEPASSADEDEGLADGLIIAMFALAGVALIAGGIYWVRRNSGE